MTPATFMTTVAPSEECTCGRRFGDHIPFDPSSPDPNAPMATSTRPILLPPGVALAAGPAPFFWTGPPLFWCRPLPDGSGSVVVHDFERLSAVMARRRSAEIGRLRGWLKECWPWQFERKRYIRSELARIEAGGEP